MAYRCIGYGVTDSNGVAKITHSCDGTQLSSSGYLGTGAGEVDIVCSTDSPSSIDTSTEVSDTCEVLDTMWYDKGLSGDGNHNDNYDRIALLSRSASGTSLDTSSVWNTVKPKISNSVQISIGDGLCFEFDVEEINVNGGQIRCTVYDGSNRITTLTDTGHYKFTITDKIRAYKDNSTTAFNTVDYDTTKTSVQIIFTNSVTGSTFKFKEYKIYPI